MNREFVQLAQVYDPKKHGIAGWFVSEKLDGMRCLWDGGITRGLPVGLVPWANTAKDKVGSDKVATGLWSRYGKPIMAPDYWLDELPAIPLDGELYLKRKSFQQLMSIVKRTVNILETEWADVRFMVFDSPTYEAFCTPGRINNVNYKKTFDVDVGSWVSGRLAVAVGGDVPFSRIVGWLEEVLSDSKVCFVVQQVQLPFATSRALDILDERLRSVCVDGGEGLIIRHPHNLWFPKRTATVLKVKPYHEGVGTVIGWKEGKGKYYGMIGSLRVSWKGHEFDLSGLTDEERRDFGWVGRTVEFIYRDLTDDGIPKEARYRSLLCRS